jgi:predicted HAD superfamily Cof-like phosphohydrolase
MLNEVKLFRYKMGLPLGSKPHLLSSEHASYHARFILEELSEFLMANEEQNLVDAADALADLTYVVLGCALHMGLPFDEIFQAVHHSNMLKEIAPSDVRSKRGMHFNLTKPKDWLPPEVAIRKLIESKWENIHGN